VTIVMTRCVIHVGCGQSRPSTSSSAAITYRADGSDPEYGTTVRVIKRTTPRFYAMWRQKGRLFDVLNSGSLTYSILSDNWYVIVLPASYGSCRGGNILARRPSRTARRWRSPCSTCISEPWRTAARRKQGRSASRRRTPGCCRKFGLTALQSTFDEFNPPSMNSTIGSVRRAEAIRRASTSVAAPIRCEPRSRWPSSGRRGPRAACRGFTSTPAVR
jgi:hypothetical protein